MSSEVSSVSSDNYDSYDTWTRSEPDSDLSNLRKAIFSSAGDLYSKPALSRFRTEKSSITTIKTMGIHNQSGISSGKSGGSGEIGIDIGWGGKNGIDFSGHAKGEIHDDRGNYAEIKAEQNNDGTGKVSISAGHKEDSR